MDASQVKARLGMDLPGSHLQALLDARDPIHEACDFLVFESDHQLLRFDTVNAFLHSPDGADPWPEHLVAFASNGCGDYFAYDLRSNPLAIVYIDPDLTVRENLSAPDRLRYASFDEWRDAKLASRSRRDG
jgi:hypothetical protein